MKIRCISNTGKDLKDFEYSNLDHGVFGRFGANDNSVYGELDIGKEYLVMGMVIFKTYQAYLIDDNGLISTCPCQLFEIIDDKMSSNWHFRLVEINEDIYPFVQAIFGYYEFCFDKKSYENLIVEKEEEAMSIYFQRKIELEKGSI